MSLHEASESVSDDGVREREERRPACCCFSYVGGDRWWWWELVAAAEADDGLAKVRRGIFAGRRVVFGDGMVAAGGLYGSSPICLVVAEEELRQVAGRGESGEWRELKVWRV